MLVRRIGLLGIALTTMTTTSCAIESDPRSDIGSLTFSVEGDSVAVEGVIDSDTPETLAALLADYPAVDVFILREIEGSEDDDASLEAARMVRGAGITTIVQSDGWVASGGTDFFLAGKERIVESGACIGVHSWSDATGREGSELHEDDAAHDPYVDFYVDMGVDEAFYWYTLDAAPSDDMHWMTWSEMRAYGVATHYDAVDGVPSDCVAPQ